MKIILLIDVYQFAILSHICILISIIGSVFSIAQTTILQIIKLKLVFPLVLFNGLISEILILSNALHFAFRVNLQMLTIIEDAVQLVQTDILLIIILDHVFSIANSLCHIIMKIQVQAV